MQSTVMFLAIRYRSGVQAAKQGSACVLKTKVAVILPLIWTADAGAACQNAKGFVDHPRCNEGTFVDACQLLLYLQSLFLLDL